jgi:hypothetical protein
MGITFQRQNLIAVAAIFGIGIALGFGWALVRPHPVSNYRRVLAGETDTSEG